MVGKVSETIIGLVYSTGFVFEAEFCSCILTEYELMVTSSLAFAFGWRFRWLFGT